MDKFEEKLTVSGYSEDRRRHIITSGLLGYSRKVRRNKEELGTRHRLGAIGLGDRLVQKAALRSNWYTKESRGDLRVDCEETMDKTKTGGEKQKENKENKKEV